MVALWFHSLTEADRVSVKPHASPVLHAISYRLGDLDRTHLPTLREKGGLQSYSSRLKDPDTVDFSTGSVGIGAKAALWVAMSHPTPGRTSPTHRKQAGSSASSGTRNSTRARSGRQLQIRTSPLLASCWVVDLNRQSPDHVVPDIQVQRLQGIRRGRNLCFRDRMGDSIRIRGENISSSEIAAVLIAHPSVSGAPPWPYRLRSVTTRAAAYGG